MKTRIGIYGYGNLGRGVESAIRQNEDMELVAVFTRRDPASLSIATDSAAVVPFFVATVVTSSVPLPSVEDVSSHAASKSAEPISNKHKSKQNLLFVISLLFSMRCI